MRHAFFLGFAMFATAEDMSASSCWSGGFSEAYCCGKRDPICWDGPYTFELCCLSKHCPGGAYALRTSTGALLCIRGDGKQVIDNYIRNFGHWPDCDILYVAEKILSKAALGSDCHRSWSFVDVGANIGACAMQAASFGWSVLAVEPSPVHVALINASRALNGFNDSRLSVLQAAAVAIPGQVTLWEVEGNSAASSVMTTDQVEKWLEAMGMESHWRIVSNLSVPGLRLDDVIEAPVGFLKVDVECHEEVALQGLERVITNLSQRPPVVFFEHAPKCISGKGLIPAAPLLFLLENGYRLFPTKTAMRPQTVWGELRREDLSSNFSWESIDILALRVECVELWKDDLPPHDLAELEQQISASATEQQRT